MLITNAYAQQAAAAGSTQDTLMGILPMILMFVVLYFLMIRPNLKKAKDHKAMVDALQKGDEVITQGGITGRISRIIDDTYVRLEVAESKDGAIELTVQKAAIGILLPKGTLKNF